MSPALLMRGLVVLAALVALIVVGRQLRGLVPGFERYLEELGGLAGVLFVVGYVVATVAFVPGSILTMAAGALFGLTTGVALVFVAATIGSTLSFLIAKLAGDVATLAVRPHRATPATIWCFRWDSVPPSW